MQCSDLSMNITEEEEEQESLNKDYWQLVGYTTQAQPQTQPQSQAQTQPQSQTPSQSLIRGYTLDSYDQDTVGCTTEPSATNSDCVERGYTLINSSKEEVRVRSV